MAIKQIKINVNELTIGMFVSGLDRPWTQTPFPLQGFYIRELDEIKELKVHCQNVYIDIAKGAGPIAVNLKAMPAATAPSKQPIAGVARQTPVGVPVAPLTIRRDIYPVQQKSLQKEAKHAKQLHQKVFSTVGEIIGQIDLGRVIPVRETQRVASEMVDSVLRNPDALTWLARVREKDEHTYSHSVRSAVWAIIFGRHIGLAKKDLDVLAMGVLLKDVGKARLDTTLLENKNRTPAEEREYEQFVGFGVDILRATDGVSPRVVAIVKNHCERINGSGFPQQLRGDKIPLLGKIAGIVTFYDDVTNPRGEMYPLAPSKAVARLYDLRNTEFQEELVIEFIRAIGLYPTGTLVELSTGEVGVVVEQNFSRRLKPKIMIVLDACKHVLQTPFLLDLAEDEKHKQALIDAGKLLLCDVDKIEILRDLEPGSYEVDIAAIRDEYLFKAERKTLLSFFKRGA